MAKNKRGRPRKSGPRDKNDKLLRLGKFVEPPEHIMERRKMFSFVTPTKGPDGRTGEIDQDVCDGIGQLHALGLLDGHPIDGLELRDIGREFAELYWERYQATAPTSGQFERRSKSTGGPPPRTRRDDRYERLDDALPRACMERTALYMLLINNFHSDKLEGWVQRLVNRELAERGVPNVIAFFDTATEGHDRHMLECAVRGLFAFHDAAMPGRYERRAA